MKACTPVIMAALIGLLCAPLGRAEERPVLEFSLDDAVKRALENNVDIVVERYNPLASAQSVRAAAGAYDPLLAGTLSDTSRTTRADNVFAGADKVETTVTTYNLSVSQAIPTGASLRLVFNNAGNDTNSQFSTYNPSYSSSLTAYLTQPLLRNLRLDATRYQLRVAKKNKEISDLNFHQTVTNTVASVKQLYYDLVYAIDNLSAAEKSRTWAQKLLDENQTKVRVGTLAPLSVVEAEAEVARVEANVISAEAAIAGAEDALKRALYPKSEPEMWRARIVPTDRPTAEAPAIDAEAAIKTALERRTDIRVARKGLESAELALTLNKSLRLPAVDLVASYGTTGTGGTLLVREGGPLGPITSTVPGGYGDAFGDVVDRTFPAWSIGVNVSYPILNRQAAAGAARARIGRDQTLASLRRLEMQIAVEVRNAARAVETNFKLFESTRASRVLYEKRLDAEQKRFSAGMSTNFLVTQAQRDLATAEVAEISAIAAFRKSMINFERVQEAGGGVTFASSASSN